VTSDNPEVRRPLNLDTSAEIECRQVERWRTMTTEEKAALVSGLTRAAYELSLAGVRDRYPNASPREVFLRLGTGDARPGARPTSLSRHRDTASAVIESVDPIAVAVAVGHVFDALGITHTIGGSIAASFAGEPRATIAIDFVAAIDESHVPALVAALSSDFYVDEEALRRAVRMRATTNLIHQATQLKVDLFVAGGTPIDELQLRRRPGRGGLGTGRRRQRLRDPPARVPEKRRGKRRAQRR
jgi:hypothetical protein